MNYLRHTYQIEAKLESNQHIIVAVDLVSTLQLKWGVELDVLGTFCGLDLEHCSYIHPLENRECPVVVGGDYIMMESRIGLVHTAPGHSQEGFLTGMKYKIPVLSPVDENDKFTEETRQFDGLDVLGKKPMTLG